MKKSEVHLSFILTLFANNLDKDNILHDNVFMRVIDDFNATYRTESNKVSDDEVMEEMCRSKTYSFHRNPTSWWMVTNYPTERFDWKEEELEGGNYYLIMDTHTNKMVEAFAAKSSLVDYMSGADLEGNTYWSTKNAINRYNDEFHAYNLAILDYVLNSTGNG